MTTSPNMVSAATVSPCNSLMLWRWPVTLARSSMYLRETSHCICRGQFNFIGIWSFFVRFQVSASISTLQGCYLPFTGLSTSNQLSTLTSPSLNSAGKPASRGQSPPDEFCFWILTVLTWRFEWRNDTFCYSRTWQFYYQISTCFG